MITVGMLIYLCGDYIFVWTIEGNDLLCVRLELDICVMVEKDYHLT